MDKNEKVNSLKSRLVELLSIQADMLDYLEHGEMSLSEYENWCDSEGIEIEELRQELYDLQSHTFTR